MKPLMKTSLLSSLLFSGSVFAIQPLNGVYFGLFGTISHGPSNGQVIFQEGDDVYHGKVGYSDVSGGGGTMLGYRWQHIRGEAELFFNRISTGPVLITEVPCEIQNEDILTPTGVCPSNIQDQFLGYSGNSTAVYGFVNGFWDFYSEAEESDLAPYLGFGVGMATVKNGNSFINTITNYSHGEVYTSNGVAYQGIIGVSYFMDSFAWCSMDYRLVNTALKPDTKTQFGSQIPTQNYTLSTLNFTINAVFG